MYVIITKPDCPWCEKAKNFLRSREDIFSEFSLANHPILIDFLRANKLTTVPQIFHNGDLIGGYEDLVDFTNWNDSYKSWEITD